MQSPTFVETNIDLTTFSQISIGDFNNQIFCQTYLGHHQAKIYKDIIPGGNSYYWDFSWPYGYLGLIGSCERMSIDQMEKWSCMFIYFWLYRKFSVNRAMNKANSFIN